MVTEQELEELKKKKFQRDKQRKIDLEAEKIKQELEEDSFKGKIKQSGKKLIKSFFG